MAAINNQEEKNKIIDSAIQVIAHRTMHFMPKINREGKTSTELYTHYINLIDYCIGDIITYFMSTFAVIINTYQKNEFYYAAARNEIITINWLLTYFEKLLDTPESNFMIVEKITAMHPILLHHMLNKKITYINYCIQSITDALDRFIDKLIEDRKNGSNQNSAAIYYMMPTNGGDNQYYVRKSQ